VTVQNGPYQGLYFSGSGESYFEVANSASLTPTTRVYFTIYPTANFNTLATLETTFENASTAIDIIIKIQTSVAVPVDGRLVVAFPKYANDGVTSLFNDYLGKTGLSPGSPVSCS